MCFDNGLKRVNLGIPRFNARNNGVIILMREPTRNCSFNEIDPGPEWFIFGNLIFTARDREGGAELWGGTRGRALSYGKFGDTRLNSFAYPLASLQPGGR